MDKELKIMVKKSYPNFQLAIDYQCDLKQKIALLGTNGSGKTTLLRLIAGFESPDEGQISFNRQTYFDATKKIKLSPIQRKIGFVFQERRLFEHLSVLENLQFAQKRSYAKKTRINFEQIITAFKLNHLLNQPSYLLSKGEAAKVALARSLIVNPDIILLDEPLSGIDEKSKKQISKNLKKILDQNQIALIYVSHNLSEIKKLCDQIIVLNAGKIKYFGKLANYLNQDKDKWIKAKIEEKKENSLTIQFSNTPIALEKMKKGAQIKIKIK